MLTIWRESGCGRPLSGGEDEDFDPATISVAGPRARYRYREVVGPHLPTLLCPEGTKYKTD